MCPSISLSITEIIVEQVIKNIPQVHYDEVVRLQFV